VHAVSFAPISPRAPDKNITQPERALPNSFKQVSSRKVFKRRSEQLFEHLRGLSLWEYVFLARPVLSVPPHPYLSTGNALNNHANHT
jgi:hypothetical protein